MFARFADDRVALVDAASGQEVSYRELGERTRALAARLAGPKALVFMFLRNSIETIIAYLAALDAGHAVALLDQQMKRDRALELVDIYRPEHLYVDDADEQAPPPDSYSGDSRFFRRTRAADSTVPHRDLAILLPTSGTTGNPKFVRLSRENVTDNAVAIARSLRIGRMDRTITNLPLHYSYGMSILNSHLTAGASVVVSDASVVEPRFWESVREYDVTSLAGVPYTYQMLERIGFLSMELPALRKMTQAGGKLGEALVRRFHDVLNAWGASFFVMYGQTEASPRISCVPPERLGDKVGSVGVAMPGGALAISTSEGPTTMANTVGEVVYRGRNVMMGYASERPDIALGDTQGDTLYTGDLGHFDSEGFLYLSGRSKRITKLFGLRLSLDDVESMVRQLGPVGAVGGPDRIHVYHEAVAADEARDARLNLARDLKIPVQAVEFHLLDELPTMTNGKVDYRRLESHGDRT